VRDVVVRVPNWLGDSVMARPFVATLAERHGADRIQVVAHPRVAEFWRAWPGLDVAALGRDAGGVTGMIRSARSIRRRGPFRLGYLLSASFSSALLFALAGVRERIGFASDARSWLLTEPVPRTPAAGTLHYSTEMLRLLGPGATTATRPLPALDWPESVRRRTRDRLRALGLDPGSYAVVAVGAAGSSKRYAPGNWQHVVAQLRADGPVVLVGRRHPWPAWLCCWKQPRSSSASIREPHTWRRTSAVRSWPSLVRATPSRLAPSDRP